MFTLLRDIDWTILGLVRHGRTWFWNYFFLGWNFVDTQFFFVLLISLVWIFVNRKWGIRLFLMSAVSRIFIVFLKEFFQLPRPYLEDPTLPLIFVGGMGFPSGAAQTSIWLPGLWIYSSRSTLSWVIGVPFGILLSFSRVYLGVHYPSDLIGGWVAGTTLLLLYTTYWTEWEEKFLLLPSRKRFAFTQAALLLLSYLLGSYHFKLLWATASGLSWGDLLLNEQYPFYFSSSKLRDGLVCLAGMGAISVAITPFFGFPVAAFFWGLWFTIGPALAHHYVLPRLPTLSLRRSK